MDACLSCAMAGPTHHICKAAVITRMPAPRPMVFAKKMATKKGFRKMRTDCAKVISTSVDRTRVRTGAGAAWPPVSFPTVLPYCTSPLSSAGRRVWSSTSLAAGCWGDLRWGRTARATTPRANTPPHSRAYTRTYSRQQCGSSAQSKLLPYTLSTNTVKEMLRLIVSDTWSNIAWPRTATQPYNHTRRNTGGQARPG